MKTADLKGKNQQGVLFYVQHLLGSGHLRRIALIARAFQRLSSLPLTIVRGGFPIDEVDFGGARVVQLPPARVADARFAPILDDTGAPITEDWKQHRAKLLYQLFQEISPRVLLTESYPFGRRAFRFELIPLLELARQTNTMVLSSVRDILVAPSKPQRLQTTVNLIRHFYHRVLVHGDPKLIPFGATFTLADQIADRICYTGYVAERASVSKIDEPRLESPWFENPRFENHPEVVVSVGGGAVGAPLLQATLEARARSILARAPWRLLCGSELPPSSFDKLHQQATDRITIERHRNDFPALLHGCILSISQAGYNTTLDILRARCPAVLVPFAQGGQSEQIIRARLLAQRGLVQLLEESNLTPTTLATAIDRAMLPSPSDTAAEPSEIFNLQGAEQSAALIYQMHQTASDCILGS